MTPPDKQRLRATLLGVAYGDSWGYPNENYPYKTLLVTRGWGPGIPVHDKLIVSDDTQLSLALATALHNTPPEDIQKAVLDNFVGWLHDPDMRGYGQTTIKAIRALDAGKPWNKATVPNSNGCGTVMRTAACAWLPDGIWQPVAAWQAATTHGGSAAIAGAVIATACLRKLVTGTFTDDDLLTCAINVSYGEQIVTDAAAWLADHPRAGSEKSAIKLVAKGMEQVRQSLVQALEVLPFFQEHPWAADISDDRFGGDGFQAQTALSCGLLCADMLADKPEEAIRRASITGGDSDTIGAVAGMFLGSRYGDVWPTEWADRLEPRYLDWINELALQRPPASPVRDWPVA